MPSKTTLIRSGVTVAVLVVAIVAGSLFAASKRPQAPSTIQLSAGQQSQDAYDKAVAALSKEETSAAIMLLERAVALDPGNTAAKAKLAALKAPSTTPGATSPATKPVDPKTPDPFLGDIDLKKLLPSSMDAFQLGIPQVMGPEATIVGRPAKSGSAATSVMWAVHDRGSAADAQTFVDSLKSGVYSTGQVPVIVREATGFFGTDGARFAVVSFARGRYAFEVIVTSSGAPSDAKSLAEKAAAAFPVTP